MTVVEPSFRAFVARMFGDEGRAWIAGLPETLAALAAEWELELGPELPGGLLACVRRRRAPTATPAILKIASPWDRPRDEIACLEAWAGTIAPQLLRADPDRGAMLLERIEPATTARDAEGHEVGALLERLQVATSPGPAHARRGGAAPARASGGAGAGLA